MPIARGAALLHTRAPELEHPALVLVRGRDSVPIRETASVDGRADESVVSALFFLVSPEGEPWQHLRLLATWQRSWTTRPFWSSGWRRRTSTTCERHCFASSGR